MISVTRHAQNAAAAVTSQTNKRHMVAVKQLILITFVYVISFVPALLVLNVTWISFWIVYMFYINNVANFFIYLVVNKEFRNETKIVINGILKKVRAGKEQTIFVLPCYRSDYPTNLNTCTVTADVTVRRDVKCCGDISSACDMTADANSQRTTTTTTSID